MEALLCGIARPLTWQQRAVFLAISSHGEKLREILEGVRRLRKRKKKNNKEYGEDQRKEELDIAIG